jgi:undecaprenyl-diphosphatase
MSGGDARAAVIVAMVAATAFALLTVLVAAGWPPLIRLDRAVADGANSYAASHPGWVWAMRVWTNAAGPAVWRVLVVLLGAWLLVRRAVLPAVVVVAALMLAWLLSSVVKVAVGRARPAVPHPYANPAGMSFPSGHAATSVVACGLLLLLVLPVLDGRWRTAAWTMAVAVPATVGYTRVGLNVHWTSDVVGGWLLGIAVIATANAALTALGATATAPISRVTGDGPSRR